MKAVFARTCALALAATLGACTTGMGGGVAPVDVTRFHLNQPFARGPIAVEPVNVAGGNTLEFSQQRNAVARQLARLGWAVVPPGARSEQVALVDVQQGSRAALAQRSPVSIGIGGSTGGWRSGVGGGVSFGLGGGGSRELIGTRLEVSLRRRSDQSVFWEGRAETEARAGTQLADPRVAAERLAEALFRDFPGESGRTIRVR